MRPSEVDEELPVEVRQLFRVGEYRRAVLEDIGGRGALDEIKLVFHLLSG